MFHINCRQTFLNSFQFTSPSTYYDCYETQLTEWTRKNLPNYKTMWKRAEGSQAWTGWRPEPVMKPDQKLGPWQHSFGQQVSDGTSVYVQETKEHLFELELLSERREHCDAAAQPPSPLWGGVRVFGQVNKTSWQGGLMFASHFPPAVSAAFLAMTVIIAHINKTLCLQTIPNFTRDQQHRFGRYSFVS